MGLRRRQKLPSSNGRSKTACHNKDTRFQTLNDDSVFATVRITAMFKEHPEAPWLEQEAEVECRKVGGKWQAEARMDFRATARAAATVTAEEQ